MSNPSPFVGDYELTNIAGAALSVVVDFHSPAYFFSNNALIS